MMAALFLRNKQRYVTRVDFIPNLFVIYNQCLYVRVCAPISAVKVNVIIEH